MGAMPRIYREGLIDQIVADLRSNGASIEASATRAGISKDSYHAWRRRGREYEQHLTDGGDRNTEEEIYLNFLNRTDAAIADSEHVLGQQIMRAAVPRIVEKRTERRIPVRNARGVVRNRNGDIEYVTEVVIETQEVFDWRAADRMLQARFPERWLPANRTELVGGGGGPIEVRAVPGQSLDPVAVASMELVMERAHLIPPVEVDNMDSAHAVETAQDLDIPIETETQ